MERVGLIAIMGGVDKYVRDVERVAKGQDKIQKEMIETERVSGRVTKKVSVDWQKMGRNMVLVGGAITAALGFGVKAAIDFESAFADVRKTVDEGEPGFRRLEDGVTALSRRLPIAREEIARTVAAAGQLGIEGVDNLLAFTEVALGLGIATDLSAEDAAFALAQLFNVTKEAKENIGAVGSVLVELGNNTATTESRILDFSRRIAASGSNAGLTSAEILALSATVLSLGVNTERGATQISSAFAKIQTAVVSGGEKLEVFADLANMTADEFATLWRTDATAAFSLFVQGLSRSGENAILILDELGLEGVRAVEVFQALARGEGDLAENIRLANDEMIVQTALAEEVARRNETAAAKMTIAWNEIKIAFAEAGESLLPLLLVALDLLTQFLAIWDAVPGPVKAAVIALVALFGLVLLGGGSITLLATAFAASGLSALLAAGHVTAFGVAVNLAIPIVGVFIAAVVALTFGLVQMGKAADESLAGAQISARINELADQYDILGDNVNLVVKRNGDLIEVLEDVEERQAALADGTAAVVELTTQQFRAIGSLVDKGVSWADAQSIIIDGLDDSEEGQRRYNAALERGAEATTFNAEQLGRLTQGYLEVDDASEEAAEGANQFSIDAEKAAVAAREAADEIARMSSRMLAMKIVADRIALANVGEAILGFGALVAVDQMRAVNSALVEQLDTRILLEDQIEKGTDALIEERRALLGIIDETNALGSAAERVAGAFTDAVNAIETARSQIALGFLIDQLRAAGGNEEALALAVLLGREAETGREIQSGIRKIVELFPGLTGAVNPVDSAAGSDLDTGIALLMTLLGGRGGSSIPSFQRGGPVLGGARGEPVLAQLHVGEFVVPADKIAALLGPRIGEGGGSSLDFTANYFELESPIRVRDDLEALRMAGRF